MRRFWFIFLFLLLSINLLAQRQWTHSDYARYNYRSFVKSDMAKQKINFSNIDYGLLNAAVYYLSNQVRSRYNKPLFRYSAALEKAAFAHSRDMVRLDFFSHTSPVSGKKSMTDRMEKQGVPLRAASENIAMNSASEGSTYLKLAQKFVKQWMDSPPHRRNLLNVSYTYIGCGAYLDYRSKNDRYKYFKVTQNLSASTAKTTPPSYNAGDGKAPESAVYVPEGRSDLRQTRYFVMIGGDYSSRESADKAAGQLRQGRYQQARVLSLGTMHNVALSSHTKYKLATAALTAARSRFSGAWLLRTGGQ